jgi:hypothetical protein
LVDATCLGDEGIDCLDAELERFGLPSCEGITDGKSGLVDAAGLGDEGIDCLDAELEGLGGSTLGDWEFAASACVDDDLNDCSTAAGLFLGRTTAGRGESRSGATECAGAGGSGDRFPPLDAELDRFGTFKLLDDAGTGDGCLEEHTRPVPAALALPEAGAEGGREYAVPESTNA